MKSFQELTLPNPLHKALAAMKFAVPTPIQAKAIPVALSRKDLIGCAQTGTGKTAAFSVPMIARLLEDRSRDALVLVPTRELASQVMSVIQSLTRYTPELRLAQVIGGVAFYPQIKALSRGPRIIVATPGRLVDHLRRGTVKLSRTGILVLDEADRMLDLGFAPQLNEILKFLPRERQTMLFSATLPPNILALAGRFLREPEQVRVGETSAAAPKIDQKTRDVRSDEKNGALLDELNTRAGTVLVFARTQSRTDRVAHYLEGYGLQVARIHGGRTQGQRTRALQGFRSGEFRVLVATDIAARGLDIDHVAHVINYDLPNVPEDYVHRIGRTGRAGRTGEALSLIAPDDRGNWRAIHRLLGKSFTGGERRSEAGGVLRPQAAPTQQVAHAQRGPRPEHRGPRPQQRAGRPERGGWNIRRLGSGPAQARPSN